MDFQYMPEESYGDGEQSRLEPSDAIRAIPFKRRAKSAARVELDRQIKELDPFLNLRQLLCEESWAACITNIQNTLQVSHNATIHQIERFVSHYSREKENSLFAQLAGSHYLLQTGLIVGASVTSSPLLYSTLCRTLSSHGSVVTSRISGRDCPNLKTALKNLISGFTSNADEQQPLPVRETGPYKKNELLADDDMRNLLAWYEAKTQEREYKPHLVLLIEDLESIEPKIIFHILESLLFYSSAILFTLLLGVATTPDVLHSTIPTNVIQRLDISHFYIESNTKVLEEIMDNLFIQNVQPIGLGPRAFEYIWKSFHDLHHSPDAVMSSIHYLYFHHFITKPFTILTLPYETRITSQIDIETVQMIKELPSFKNLRLTSKLSFIEDYIDVVKDCYQIRLDWELKRRQGYQFLLFLRRFWKVTNLTNTSLILKLWDYTIVDSSSETCNSVLNSGFQKIYVFLINAIEYSNRHEGYDELRSIMEEYLIELENLGIDFNGNQEINLKNGNIPGSELINGKLTDKDRIFTKIARNLSDILIQYFRDCFVSFDTLPLYELWFSNDVAPIKRFNPSIVSSVKKTLDTVSTTPGIYTPDLAVAYRLYKDAGRSINLGDWWRAFERSMTQEDFGLEQQRIKSRKKYKKENGEAMSEQEKALEKRNHARFIQAVGDLAYLGFIQPNSHKKEHVQKMVF